MEKEDNILIEIYDLCAGYEKRKILQNINAAFPKGKLTAVVGPNGSGKPPYSNPPPRFCPSKAEKFSQTAKAFCA